MRVIFSVKAMIFTTDGEFMGFASKSDSELESDLEGEGDEALDQDDEGEGDIDVDEGEKDDESGNQTSESPAF